MNVAIAAMIAGRLRRRRRDHAVTRIHDISILGGVTYVLVVARTSTPTVPMAVGVSYGYAPAVTRVLGPTIAMSVTILKL